jgi:peptide/nickel transport system permease protein
VITDPPVLTGGNQTRTVAPPTPMGRWSLRRPGLVLSLLALVLVGLAVVAPGLLTHRDPLLAVPAEIFSPPSSAHLFGTDELGRDLFARVVHGTALSLRAAVIAVAAALAVGGLLGLTAGFLGGRIDDLLMRAMDVVLAIPAMFLALALVTALGPGPVNVALAVGLTGVAGFARVTRAQTLRIRTATYVEAATVAGVRRFTVLRRHVLPHTAGPVLALATLDLAGAILAVSALSFLGYGAVPPTPEWGALIAGGRNYLPVAWWYSTLPGLTVTITVLAVNRVGRAIDG